MATTIKTKQENINGRNVIFLFVESFKDNERVSKVRDSLADDSWVSKLSDSLKQSYEKRIEITLKDFDSKIKDKKEDALLSYIGEKIVTICANNAIDEELHYQKLPLGEVFKSRASGNGGFDYFNEDLSKYILIFGEGKYVNGVNAYNKAFCQISDFINEGKDVIDIGDLANLVDQQTIDNFVNEKMFSAGFSVYSAEDKIDEIIKNIKENDYFVNLVSKYDLIIVGVLFND